MKRKLTSALLVLIVVFVQAFAGINYKVKAQSNNTVNVIVESYDGMMVSGSSTKLNAFDALKSVCDSKGINIQVQDSSFGKYITAIGNVSQKHFNGYDGWIYAVRRNGNYVDVSTGIFNFSLMAGDELVLYYGDATTLTANNIEFSTTSPNKPFSITLNNTYKDYQTGAPVTTAISSVSAKIDGKQVAMSENKIVLNQGLQVGQHTLELSDYNTSRCPKVVADKFQFNIENPQASVRVEGLNGTIVEGTAMGANALDIIKNVLNNNKISYKITSSKYGNYISSVNNLNSGNFGGYDGWQYYVKNASGIISPEVGSDSYIPDNGDSIILYYGDSTTPYVNKIGFNPSIVNENQSFTMRFSYNHFDFIKNAEMDTPIENAIVNIDNKNYITNPSGEIAAYGLSKGVHTYKISGYNIGKLPTVVMDKGVFTIDNIHTPSFNYSDSSYNDIYNRDNTRVVKDIPGEISYIADFIKNNAQDTWAQVSLEKLGLKSNENLIDENAQEIKKYGIKDYANTDLEKLIISLTAMGYSPYNFMGYNLVSELYSRDLNGFLVNDAIFALLAYNYANIPDKYPDSKEKLVSLILNDKSTYKLNEKELQGWALAGNQIDPDITGAAINALSPYYDSRADVKAAIDQAVNTLSILQNNSGYIPNSYGIYSESLSFVILGLTSIGVNPEGVLFTKSDGDLVSALISFKGNEGEYKHSLNGGNDYIASEEALRAFIALREYEKYGKYNFYSSNIDASKLPIYENQNTTSIAYLPKTGSFLDNTTLLTIGSICIVLGSVLIIGKRKKFKF